MLAGLRKCLVLLTPRERWRWAGLIPLAVVAAAMEAAGAAAVFALIKIIGAPSQVSALPAGAALVALLPWKDERAIVLFFTIAVAFFYIVKNVVLAAVAAAQSRAVSESTATLSLHMLHGYLAVPFAFHFQRNSSELIRNSTDTAEAVFGLVMASAVGAASEAFVVLGIVVVLMLTAPSVTLIAVVVLFSLLAGLLRLTRRTLSRWGGSEQELKRATLQTLRQALGGLKEVKVQGRERFFYERFGSQQRALIHLHYLFTVLSATSRLLIETVFVCGMLLVIVLVTARGSARPEIVPLLGLFAYGGFRIIPSVNRILLCLSNIRYGSAAVERVYDDFVAFRRYSVAEFDAPEPDGISFTDRLVLDRVSFSYDGSQTAALQDVRLTIRRGESIGIVGPTGAGKSTLIDIILGLLQPSAGGIAVDGVDISTALRSWQRKIGYVPQTVYLLDDSMRRNIAFGLRDEEIDERTVRAAVHMAQLNDMVAALPNGLDTVIGERGVRLSGGERQRVAIARALCHEPELLVFDEATSALDSQTERELTRAIEALHGKKTLIIIAHRLSTVRHCDRLVFLRDGRVAGVGSFDELAVNNTDFRNMASMTADGETSS